MHSHTSAVINGYREYIQEVSRYQCNKMHEEGVFLASINTQITGLRVIRTSSHAIMLAGSTQINGQCLGSQYSHLFGTWENVIVHAKYRITLQEYQATININTDKIHLKSGVICSLSDTTCTDELDGGQTFWNTLPNDNCNSQKYTVLYEGSANTPNQCYLQLPIHKGNETLFLTPSYSYNDRKRNRNKLQYFSTTNLLFIDACYKLYPNLTESLPPSIMKPTTKTTWKCTNPASPATSGIYTQADLDKLRDHIMFCAEKPNVLNSIAL